MDSPVGPTAHGGKTLTWWEGADGTGDQGGSIGDETLKGMKGGGWDWEAGVSHSRGTGR